MDIGQLILALRGGASGEGQMAPPQGGGEGQMAPPQGGGGDMVGGGIALSGAYQQYRQSMMLEGMTPLPPREWMAQQQQGGM